MFQWIRPCIFTEYYRNLKIFSIIYTNSHYRVKRAKWRFEENSTIPDLKSQKTLTWRINYATKPMLLKFFLSFPGKLYVKGSKSFSDISKCQNIWHNSTIPNWWQVTLPFWGTSNFNYINIFEYISTEFKCLWSNSKQ